MVCDISVNRHLAEIGAIAPGGELGHLLVNEALFFLRDIKFHLDIPFPVRHAPPPFFIRVWDYPNKHFSFSGKGPENQKNRKRVLACCACYRNPYLLISPSTNNWELPYM